MTTRRNQFGDSVDINNLGAGLVRAFPAGRSASPPIQWRKFCLNGVAASAQFQNLLNEATNQAVVQRTRQLFTAACRPDLYTFAAGSASRASFRFAFRTGTYHSRLHAFVTMQPPRAANGNSPSYVRLKIFSDTAEATAVTTTDFYYGASPQGVGVINASGYRVAKTVSLPVVGLSPNTNYYACFYEQDYGSLQTATVIEMQSMTEHFDGYLPTNLNQDSEVVSTYREKIATIQKNLWKNSGRSLINWTVADGTAPLTRTSATAINIVDGTSTAVSVSTPGYTLDMRYKTRVSQSTIPGVIKVFGKGSVATIGSVTLKDSTGATLATVSGFGTTASWLSTTFNMPSTLSKYDLHFSSNGANTFSLYAVSIYEFET